MVLNYKVKDEKKTMAADLVTAVPATNISTKRMERHTVSIVSDKVKNEDAYLLRHLSSSIQHRLLTKLWLLSLRNITVVWNESLDLGIVRSLEHLLNFRFLRYPSISVSFLLIPGQIPSSVGRRMNGFDVRVLASS